MSDDPPPTNNAEGKAPITGRLDLTLEDAVLISSGVSTLPTLPPNLQSTLDSLPPIPPQGFAPHVEIDENGRIVFAPPASLDAERNYLPRLRSLLPDLIEIADELRDLLARGNQAHFTLQKRLEAYRARLHADLEQVNLRRVLTEGLRLESAAIITDAQTKIEDGLPPLDTEAHETLASLLRLNRMFVMATADGPAMLTDEARYNRTREEEAAHQVNMRNYAAAVAQNPDVIAQDVRDTLTATLDEPGDSLEASRTRRNGEDLGLNIAIVAVGSATLAAAVTALGGAAPPGNLAAPYAANLLSILGGITLGNPSAIEQTRAALGDAWNGLARRLAPATRLLARTRGVLSVLARKRDSRFALLLPSLSWLDSIGGSIAVAADLPPPEFSPEEVKRRILAGEPIDSAWRPFVTELALGLPADARPNVYDAETLAKAREAAAGSYIDTAAPLAQFPNLARLDLWGTQVTDLTPLASLTTLQSLDLRYTQVTDLAPLSSLTALQSLDLTGTQVTDLAPLASLTALQSLNLWDTQVTDLAPLASLTALQSLNLERTKVTDLAPLAALPNLRRLHLTGLRAGIESALPRRAEITITRR